MSKETAKRNRALTTFLKETTEAEPLLFDKDWNLIFKVVEKLNKIHDVQFALNGKTARVYTKDLDSYKTMTLATGRDEDLHMAAHKALTNYIKEWTLIA